MKLKDILDRLPKESEKIADFFNIRNIKGRPYDECNCPIANYVKSFGYNRVVVSQRLCEVITDNNTIVESCDMPESCKEFIEQFDYHCFPFLEK